MTPYVSAFCTVEGAEGAFHVSCLIVSGPRYHTSQFFVPVV